MRTDAGSPPSELAALVDLLDRHRITAFEFGAAFAYWQVNVTERVAIEARIRGAVERAIIRNLIVKQMAPDRAVYAATACHPSGVIHRIREALDQLGEAMACATLN
jgi:hypothetical protein